ncbi:hypothetical protein [Streptomyces lasiicapitis]|uniref:hypothetical protein n=1 Tax=Streptomyces lasiicapitis TaxID=1923961 RepID=UPI00365DB7D8
MTVDEQLKQILAKAGKGGVTWVSVLRQLGAQSAEAEAAGARIGAVVAYERTGQVGRPVKVVKLGEPAQ